MAPYRPWSVHSFTKWNIVSLYPFLNGIDEHNNELICSDQDNLEIIHIRDVLVNTYTKIYESRNIYRKLISVYAIVNLFTEFVLMKE